MLTSSSPIMSRAKASRGVALALLIATVGCGTLQLPAAFEGFVPVSKSGVTDGKDKPVEKTKGTFEVLMKSRFGKNRKSTQTLESTVLLQDVLKASGAIKRYRAMDITIYRPVKGSPVPLQMQCDYDSSKDSVSEAENYEIYPGDQILIEEVSGSVIGKLINEIPSFDRG